MTDEWEDIEKEWNHSNGDFFAKRTALLLMVSGLLTSVPMALVLVAIKTGELDGAGSTSMIDVNRSLLLGLTILALSFWARRKPVPACLAAILIIVSDRAVEIAHDPRFGTRGTLWLAVAVVLSVKCIHSHWLAHGRKLPDFGKTGLVAFGSAVAYWVIALALPSGSVNELSRARVDLSEDEQTLVGCVEDGAERHSKDCGTLFSLWNLGNNDDDPATEALMTQVLDRAWANIAACDDLKSVDGKRATKKKHDRHFAFIRLAVEKSGKISRRELLAVHPKGKAVTLCIQMALNRLKFKPPADKKAHKLSLVLPMSTGEPNAH